MWDIVRQIVQDVSSQPVNILRSSRSVDVVAPGVSKRAVVEYLRRMASDAEAKVLCIGDRGRWPGNDHALLMERSSLSVDEVSPDPETCWNLAIAGQRGVQATLGYLRAMDLDNGILTLRAAKITAARGYRRNPD